MDTQSYQKMLQKFLDHFILPKYEDILSYEIGLLEYKFHDKFIFDIRFFMDGTEQSVEDEISDDISHGLKVLGINKDVTFDTFFETG